MMDRRTAGLLGLVLVTGPALVLTIRDFRAGKASIWAPGVTGVPTFDRTRQPIAFWATNVVKGGLALLLSIVCLLMVVVP